MRPRIQIRSKTLYIHTLKQRVLRPDKSKGQSSYYIWVFSISSAAGNSKTKRRQLYFYGISHFMFLLLCYIPLNRVDSEFPWCICSGLNKNHPIGTIKPTHLKIVFVREHIGKIQIACDPINGDATNPIWPNTILNYWLKFCAIWSNTENAIPDASVELNPVYPILCIVHINMENMVPWKRTLTVHAWCEFLRVFNYTNLTADVKQFYCTKFITDFPLCLRTRETNKVHSLQLLWWL